MARLPGLTPNIEDRPSGGGRNRGRVAVNAPDIRPQRLSPNANPVNTYARPEAAPQTNSWLQLAEALGTIAPGLQSMLQERSETGRKEAEDRAMKRIGGMSFAEAEAAVKSGKIGETNNPWFKAAFMKQYGERLAHHRAQEIATLYETEFDKDNGNLDELVAGKMKEDLEAYGDNKFFASTYVEIMQRFNTSAQAKQAEYQAGRTKDQSFEGVYDTFLGTARQMATEGKTPAEIAAALRGKYQGNRELLNIPFKEQDKELLRAAQTLAEDGQYDLVKELLTGERTAPDGTKLGSLTSNRELGADANRILASAEKSMFEANEKKSLTDRLGFFDKSNEGTLDRKALLEWHKANPGALSDGQVQSLIGRNDAVAAQAAEEVEKQRNKFLIQQMSNRSHEAMDEADMVAADKGLVPYLDDAVVLGENGEEKIVPADKRREAVAARISEQARAAVDAKKLTPEQGFAFETRKLAANGLVNKQWKSVLSAGPVAANAFTLSGGEVPPALAEGADLYMRLHAENPRLLKTHITDQATLDFYEAFRLAKEYGRASDTQALQQAAAQNNDPDKYEGVVMRQRYDDIAKAVSSLSSNGFITMFGAGTPRADNEGYVGNEISRLAQFYARQGLGSDKAIEEATSRFRDTHTQVGGWWVYTADRDIPPSFDRMVQEHLQSYADTYGELEGVEADDLTIRPASNGSGAWTIINRHTATPVENFKARNFTNRVLLQNDATRQQEKQKAIVDQTNAENEHRYDPWLVINQNTFFGPFMGNSSPEEQERVRQRAKEIYDERQRGR